SVFIVGLFLLPETYAPVLLARAVKRVRKEGGSNFAHISTRHEASGVRFKDHLKTHITRPMKLFRFSVVSLMSVYSRYILRLMRVFGPQNPRSSTPADCVLVLCMA